MTKSTVETSTKVSLDLTEAPIQVLHVDDEAGFLKASKQILEMQGAFEVETASSVEEALEKIEEKTYDAIISDYMMPEKGGLDFLKELRDSGNDIPFIMFTGKGREEVAIKALNLGVYRYFNKIGEPGTVYCELAHGIRQAVKTRQTEEALRESEEKHRSLLENARDAIMTLDLNGNITFVNRVIEEYGFKKDEIVGKSMAEFASEKYLPRLIKDFAKVIRGNSVEGEIEIMTPKGKIISEYRSNPIRRGNKVVGSQTILRDITERKKAETALIEREEKYRALAESITDTFFAMDRNLKYTYWNKASEKLTGIKAEDAIGKSIFEIFPNREDTTRTVAIYQRVLQTEQTETFLTEFQLEDKDYLFEISAYPTRDGISVFVKDITERKKMEEERNKLLGDYAERVKELSCLYGIAKHVEKPKISLEEILRGTNDLLPAAWRYPDVACSRVVFGNREFKTKNFKETQWRQCSDIKVNGKKVGSVEIYYLEEKPTIAEGPFLKEERTLIDAVTERLGRIIERKKAENALKKSEERYRSLFDLAPDSIITANAKGVVTSVNTTFTRLTGFSKDEIIGKHFTKVGTIRKRDLPMFLKMFTSLLRGKAPKPFEVMWKHKDGTTHPTEIHIALVKSDGKPIGFQAITRDITERKKAKEALRNANEKWISLMENTDDVIMVLDGKGTIQYLNPASLATNPREVIGKSVYEYVPREQHDIMRKSLRRVFKTGKPDSYEVSPIIQGIDTIWFNTKVVPIKHDKNIVSVILISTNITERKKTEKALRESEERFRTIFEGATDGILAVDHRTQRFVFANPRVCEITGYSSEELLKLSVNDIHPKEDLPYVIDQFTKQLEGNATLSTHIPVLKKDKQVVYCDVNSNMLKIGKQQYLVGFFRDITERNEAEEKVETERRKLRDIIEAIADSVCITGLDDKITMVNKAMVDLFQVSREKLLTLKGFDLATKEDLPKISKAMQNLFKTGLPQNAEVTGRLGGAKGKPFWIRFSSLKDEKGRPTGFVTVTRDITERKKTQEKLVMMNEKLRVVGGLTRHDVRNKLSAAKMNNFLAKKKLTGNKEALKHLWEIDVAIGLTEKIFDFARTYEKLGVEELAYMDVEKSLKEAVMSFSDLHGVKVVNDCHGLTVLADSLLRQLFYNLVDNSLKHGEKVSRIRMYYKEGKDQLKILYEDNGVGIPKVEKEKIFKEGYGKGTGYGLYLIEKMCGVYGWTIQETGKPGKGAQFTITMPRMHKEGRESYVFTDALQSIEKILRADLI